MLELAAAVEFLEIADNGASRDPEFAGQGGDVRTLLRLAQHLADAILPAEAVSRAAEKLQGIDPPRTFQRLELADHLGFAAFLERGFHGAPQFVNIHRLGQAIMRAART